MLVTDSSTSLCGRLARDPNLRWVRFGEECGRYSVIYPLFCGFTSPYCRCLALALAISNAHVVVAFVVVVVAAVDFSRSLWQARPIAMSPLAEA